MTSSYRGYARASGSLNSGKIVDPSQKILQRNQEFLEDFRRIREFERQQEADAFRQYQTNTKTAADSQINNLELQADYGRIVSDQQARNVQKKQAAMQKAFDRKGSQPSGFEKALGAATALKDFSQTATKLVGDYNKAKAAEQEKEDFSTPTRIAYSQLYGDLDTNPVPKVTPNSLMGAEEQANSARIIASDQEAMSAVQEATGDIGGALDSQRAASQTSAAFTNPARQRLMLKQTFASQLGSFDGLIPTDNGDKQWSQLSTKEKAEYFPYAKAQIFHKMGIDPRNMDPENEYLINKIANDNSMQYFASEGKKELTAGRQNDVNNAAMLFQEEPSAINAAGMYMAFHRQAGGDDRKARESMFEEFESANYTNQQVNTFLTSKVPGLEKSWQEQFKGDARELLNKRSENDVRSAEALDNERQINDLQRAEALRTSIAADMAEDGVYNGATADEISTKIKEFRATGDLKSAQALELALPRTVSAIEDERIDEYFTELELNGVQGDLTQKMVLESDLSAQKKKEWLARVQQFDATAPTKQGLERAKGVIENALKHRAKFNSLGATRDPSINNAINYAMDQYQADYKEAMLQPNATPSSAQEYALGRFQKELGTDDFKGTYAILDVGSATEIPRGKSTFTNKSFEITPVDEGPFFTDLADIRTALQVPNATSAVGLIPHEQLKSISVQSLKQNGIPANIQYIASQTNLPAFEILNRQLKAADLPEIPQEVYESAKEAQNTVTSDLQHLLNKYPSPTRTDIAMIGSGQEPVYSSRVPTAVKDDIEFQRGVAGVAERLGVSAGDLMAVMDFETGGTFNPAKKNMAGSGATGLIQIVEPTAIGLGTTTAELAQMSRVQQLEYVEKHLKNIGIKSGSNLSDLYMAVLFPAAIGKPDDFVLFGNGAMPKYRGTAYTQNASLDKNGDGSVTKGEAVTRVVGHANVWRQARNLNPAVVAAQSKKQTRTKEQGPGSGYWKWDEQRNLWVKGNAN
jgi:hypothetical protein